MLDINNLHQYQKATVNHICKFPYCGIFLDMGLGKTVSTLTAIEWMLGKGKITKVLIIAPKRVAESVWEEETTKWSHLQHLQCRKIIGTPVQRMAALSSSKPIHIISRDNLVWLKDNIKKFNYDMVVVDELSSFKSNTSQRFKALKAFRPYAKRFVGLTGTPAPNSLMDLWPQMWLIDMGARLGKTITNYRDRFFKPLVMNGRIVYKWGLRPGCDKIIQDSISDICISMQAKDYLDLPERIDNTIMVKMDAEETKKYKTLEKWAVLFMGDDIDSETVSATTAASLTNKLLQMSNGSVYMDDGTTQKIHTRKLDALDDIIDSCNGQPILVAWIYRFDRDSIMERFKHLNPRELKDNKDIEDWNNGKIQLLLTHPASAGHGLNLQAGGNIIVWFGLTWSLELYQQFNARLHRQGQKNGVIVHHILTENTLDSDVMSSLAQKDCTQDSLMRAVKAKIDEYITK